MPEKNKHIKRAQINEEFGDTILKFDKKFRFWAITAYHYSALHWVDAYLSTKNFHPRIHSEREKFLSLLSNLRENIYHDYHEIRTVCRESRYETHNFSRDQVFAVKKYLKKIKTHIQNLLKNS